MKSKEQDAQVYMVILPPFLVGVIAHLSFSI